MKRYLMGIDNGGSNTKCAIFDLDGNEVAVADTPVPTDRPKTGYAERDTEVVWEKNAFVIQEALKKANIPGEAIKAVGLTGYGNGIVLLDGDFKATYPAIVSTDDRASEYCKQFRENGTDEEVFPITLQTTWSAQPAALLPWFRDHHPEVLAETQFILSLKDFIRIRLTGSVAGEITDASSGCLVNLETRQYDPRLFEIFDIEECYEKMPPVLESTDISGRITEEAASLTGLAPGTPVAAGYFDIDANALASGIVSEEELCLIAGTWSINEYLSKEAPRRIEDKANTVTLSYLKDYFLIEESTPTSASNFSWFLSTLLYPDESDKSLDTIYKECNELVAKTKPEDCAAIFVPYLFGSATHPDAHGAFINLTGDIDRAELLRAVFEGVVFSTVHHVHALKRPIGTYSKARLSGGVSRSEVWSQMMSDALQMPIETLTSGELGAKGAAMGAGVACEIFKNVEEAAKRMVHVGKVYSPRKSNAQIYAQKFANYRTALKAVDLLAEQI